MWNMTSPSHGLKRSAFAQVTRVWVELGRREQEPAMGLQHGEVVGLARDRLLQELAGAALGLRQPPSADTRPA